MLRTRRRLSSAMLAALALTAVASQFSPAAEADPGDHGLTVVVNRDVNANSEYERGEDEPQPGITITVSDAGGTTVEGETNPDGAFELPKENDLEGGRYFVVAAIPPNLALAPVPESESFAALSTTVDVTTDDHTVRMGVVVEAPVATPEPTPEPGIGPPPSTERDTGSERISRAPAPRFAVGDLVWRDLNHSGIQDPGEPPARRVSVQLLDADGDVVRSTVTTAAGRYWFDQLPPGRYSIRFAGVPRGSRLSDPGAGGAAEDSNPDYTGSTPPFDLGVGEAGTRTATAADLVQAAYVNSTIDAGITPLRYAVDSQVWLDLDANGVQGDAEPAASATVTLLDGAGAVLAAVPTDASGRYQFGGLDAGTYQVRFSGLPPNRAFTLRGAGGDTSRDSDPDPQSGLTDRFILGPRAGLQLATVGDTADADYIQTGIDAGLVGTYSIGDTVWRDGNGDGLLNRGEPGVEGVSVELQGADGRVIDTRVTSGSGRYTFGQLPAGTYRIAVRKLPAGLKFTGQRQGGDSAVDSDAGALGATELITLGDDNPADKTVDVGVTPLENAVNGAGAQGGSSVVDTALSTTGGVSASIPVGGALLVGLGSACLLLQRRRGRRGVPAAG